MERLNILHPQGCAPMGNHLLRKVWFLTRPSNYMWLTQPQPAVLNWAAGFVLWAAEA